MLVLEYEAQVMMQSISCAVIMLVVSNQFIVFVKTKLCNKSGLYGQRKLGAMCQRIKKKKNESPNLLF